MRPFRAMLSTEDYWHLQEHRRRCEDLGGDIFLRLASLIRAKSADARILAAEDLPPDTVTGRSRVIFALANRQPEVRTLYQSGYPDRARNRLAVCSFLGLTLIGLSVGQRARLLDAERMEDEVHVLAVHALPLPEAPARA
jgi:transcription elongation GreA/GreB family factor